MVLVNSLKKRNTFLINNVYSFRNLLVDYRKSNMDTFKAVRSIFTSMTDTRNKRDFPDEMMCTRVSHSSRGLCLNRYHHY